MPTTRHQSWRREVLDGTHRDALIFATELRLADDGSLTSWDLSARLERGHDDAFICRGIHPSGSIDINHTFENHVELSGTLSVVPTSDSFVIWADVQYGFDLYPPHYFQGAVAEGPSRNGGRPHLDPDPEPYLPFDPGDDHGRAPDRASDLEPDHDPGLDSELAPPGSGPAPRPIGGLAIEGEEGDLFPYTYMRCWPDPDRQQIAQRFFSYPFPVDAAPTGALLQQLAALRAQGGDDARAAMQALTVDFLNGGVDPAAPFLDRVEALAGPIAAYPRIYALLTRRDRRSAELVVAELWRALGMTCEETASYLATAAHRADVAQLWQSYLALVVELGFDRAGRTRLVQVLIVEHALGWLTGNAAAAENSRVPVEPKTLDALAGAVAVLPEAIFPLPPAGGAAHSPPEICDAAETSSAIVPYAIGELLMVRHALRGYSLGELSGVESIRAGERREVQRRQLERTVESTATARHDAEAREHTGGASNASLTSEVLGTLADAVTTTTYNDFGTSYGPPTTATLTGGWTVEQKPAGDPSKEQLTRFAREVLSKAVHRISHRVAEVRSRSVQRDSEETVKSVVDNAQGARNRRAVYRWLDEVYGARVVNYGNRLLMELILEAPAAHLLHGARAPGRLGHGHGHQPPLPPAAIGVESYEDIDRHNFAQLVARYPSDAVEMPPAERRVVSAALRSGEARTIELPEGYQATSATLGYALAPGQTQLKLQGVLGRRSFQLTASSAGVESLKLDGEDGEVQALVECDASGSGSGSGSASASGSGSGSASASASDSVQLALEILTEPTSRTMDAWRLRTFQALQRSYASQCEAFERSHPAEAARLEAVRPRASARALERKQLKHGAIELLFSRLHQRVGDSLRPAPGHPPGELELAAPRYLRFFETAFEWQEMTYSFLSARSFDGAPPSSAPSLSPPSPASPPSSPAALPPSTSTASTTAALAGRFGDDPRFLEFLESAYARLLVPVTMEHAPALLFFLSSGALWDGPATANAHVAAHAADVALVNELINGGLAGSADHPGTSSRAAPRLVRELPAIRVPTSIAVLTDGDVPLLPGATAMSLLTDAHEERRS